jgi:phosphomevalonate kinase
VAGVTASAPAKLVLSGEYAVLHGGPAISAAVGVRACATVAPTADSWSLRITNSGQSFDFSPAAAGGIEWRTDPGEMGQLLAAAWGVLNQAQALSACGPHVVELDSRAFFTAAGAKRGLGSSAAVAVALTAALQTALGVAPTAAACLAVHAAFQQQRGSGIDVCTSFHGGVITKTAAAVEPLGWPEELCAAAVWTGMPASTTALLSRMEAFAASHPAAFERAREPLHVAAAATLSDWRAAPAAQVLESLYEFARQLHRFDDDCAIGIWSAEHVRLERLADDFGLVYKPSGAGGGDYGLAFGLNPERLEDFVLAAGALGFTAPDFDLSVPGLRVQPLTGPAA